MPDFISELVSASLHPPNRKDPHEPPSPTWEDGMPQPTCGHVVAICVPTAQHPFRHFSANVTQLYSGNPYHLSVPGEWDSTLGPQPPCDSVLANQSACISSATLTDQEGANAPLRPMRPQEIYFSIERRADFFCQGLNPTVAICWHVEHQEEAEMGRAKAGVLVLAGFKPEACHPLNL